MIFSQPRRLLGAVTVFFEVLQLTASHVHNHISGRLRSALTAMWVNPSFRVPCRCTREPRTTIVHLSTSAGGAVVATVSKSNETLHRPEHSHWHVLDRHYRV